MVFGSILTSRLADLAQVLQVINEDDFSKVQSPRLAPH